MNRTSTAYMNHLIIKNYCEAIEHENQICAVTKVNDPIRNQAIRNACDAVLAVAAHGLQKEVGMTFFNVWD